MAIKKIIKCVKAQIDDFIWQKDISSRLILVYSFLIRRGVPLPSVIFEKLSTPVVDVAVSYDELGNESFLSSYIIPSDGKCLVDVGANVGVWTMYAAKKGIEVHAFEPSPNAYKRLTETTLGYNVHTYPYALGNMDTTVTMGVSQFDFGIVLNAKATAKMGVNTENVQVHSLDSLGLYNVGVIKIDTEGYEVPILKGASNTILRNNPLLIIEVHKQTGEALESFEAETERVKRLLLELNYSIVKVHFRPLSLNQMQPHIIAKPIS